MVATARGEISGLCRSGVGWNAQHTSLPPLAFGADLIHNRAMANQFTKSVGGRYWGGRLPTKFSAELTPELADQLDKLSGILNTCKADLFREFVAWAYKRADAITTRYPDIPVLALWMVTDGVSPEQLARMQANWAKEHAKQVAEKAQVDLRRP